MWWYWYAKKPNKIWKSKIGSIDDFVYPHFQLRQFSPHFSSLSRFFFVSLSAGAPVLCYFHFNGGNARRPVYEWLNRLCKYYRAGFVPYYKLFVSSRLLQPFFMFLLVSFSISVALPLFLSLSTCPTHTHTHPQTKAEHIETFRQSKSRIVLCLFISQRRHKELAKCVADTEHTHKIPIYN